MSKPVIADIKPHKTELKPGKPITSAAAAVLPTNLSVMAPMRALISPSRL